MPKLVYECNLEDEFKNLESLDKRLEFVPYFEKLYKKIHTWSYKYGFHDRLHANKIYRWWGHKFGYHDPTRALSRVLVNEIRKEIDLMIIEDISKVYEELNGTSTTDG